MSKKANENPWRVCLRKFFQEKSNFLWGRAIGMANDYWSAKGHLRKSRYGDHVTSTAAVVDAESWVEYVTIAH